MLVPGFPVLQNQDGRKEQRIGENLDVRRGGGEEGEADGKAEIYPLFVSLPIPIFWLWIMKSVCVATIYCLSSWNTIS